MSGASQKKFDVFKPQRLRFGETVFMVRSPQGFKNTVSKGIVANPKRIYKEVRYIQTDAAMYHGNSGGPLFNRKGVVGIVSWGRRGESGAVIDNLNFAVPIDYLSGDIELADLFPHRGLGRGSQRGERQG
jgi:S1-C subfamily serine protease